LPVRKSLVNTTALVVHRALPHRKPIAYSRETLRRTSAAGYWSLRDATNIKDEIITDQCRRKRTGRPTEMTQNITLDTKFFRDLITSLDLIEKSCRQILEEVGEKIETAACLLG
jgi:hypothetical protein